MSRVRGRDTGPELLLRRALFALGVRGWRCHRANLPGKPDIAFGRSRLAVFVDGAFWHGHPSRYWQGRSGPYWDAKIARNQARDRRVDAELQAQGWSVLRLWDFEVEADPAAAAQRVRDLLDNRPHR
jgi:DNA mismatch endonuclease (patch repair protein)